MRFSVKLKATVVNALFSVSVITSRMNGVGIENSDRATCCDSTRFKVEGII